jgi:hypothetical protein
VLVVVGGASLWHTVSARKWFKGPRIQGTPEELTEIERDQNAKAFSKAINEMVAFAGSGLADGGLC